MPGSSGGIERGLAVIEALAEANTPLPAAVLASTCGIPRSSLHRMLTGLEARGYLRVDPGTRRWGLGKRLSELAASNTTATEALAVIEAFNRERWRLHPRDISRRSGLAVARAARAARELERAGWLSRDGDAFTLSPRVTALAGRIEPLERLRAGAREPLEALRDATGETANLLVRNGSEALYVEQVESRNTLRHSGWIGRAIPIEGTAAGAALLDPGGGIHLAEDSVERGVTAIAAGIHYPRGVAAISVIAPTVRLQSFARKRVRESVLRAAAEVERACED